MNGAHIVERLVSGAQQAPDELAYIFVGDSKEERLTRAQLYASVRRIAGNLLRHCAPGDRVAIQLPQGAAYVTVFWACLFAGLVPVPLYPSANPEVRRRLAGILADSGASLSVYEVADGTGGQLEMAALMLDGPPAAMACLAPESLAYLQYSSGSTGAPKGVMISHRNIMANLAMLAESASVRAEDVFVNWLPLHHDLGLVNTVLLPMATGSLSVIGTPLSFMRNPLSWLDRLSHYGGTISGGPNFAYQAVLDRLRSRPGRGAALLATLDLSRWRIAFNAAEPVQAATLEAFATAFEPAGFAAGSFFAAYGMAEATVFVCGAPWNPDREALQAPHQARTVACGAADGRDLVVVDADGQRLPPGAEGEIWIRGPHVSAGYFGRADDAQSPFHRFTADGEGPFFATGDSGLVEGGQLYVLGRIKDIVIQNGRNIYPADVEQVVQDVLAGDSRYAGIALVGKRQGGTEVPVVVLEARSRAPLTDPELAARISSRVFEEQGVLLDEIVMVALGGIPRTSSGKVRRQALAQALDAGQLPAQALLSRGEDDEGEAAVDAALEARLAAVLAALTGQVVDQPHRSFFAYGISSLQIAQLVVELEEHFGAALSIKDVFEHPSLRRLSNLLCSWRQAEALPPPATQDRAVLSANQQLMLSIEGWSPGNPAYHLPLLLDFDAGIDPARLARSAEQALMRHAILRTAYPPGREGGYAPQLLPASGFRIPAERVDGSRRGNQLDALIGRAFDLGSGYPVRGQVLTGGAGEAVTLALVFHHIAADGWSLRLLAQQILARYGTGDAPQPQEEAAVAWSVRPVAAASYQSALAYWKDSLAGLPDVHNLPLDGARPAAHGRAAAGRHAIRLDPGAVQALRTLCAGQDATLFSGVHALLALALARFGNQADIVLGTFLAGRDTAEQRAQIGFQAQAALLRTRLDLDSDMAGLIRDCRDTLLAAREHAVVGYLDLLRELKPVRDPSYNPLFQISLNYHDYGAAEVQHGGLRARILAVAAAVARYDLSVDLYPDAGGLRICFEYDTALFGHGTIVRLADFWERLLASALSMPGMPVGRLPGHDLPAPPAPPDSEVSLYERVRAVAAANPRAVAVRHQGKGLTYRELSDEVDRLAQELARFARAGDRVLIFMHRTPAYMTAILAILKLDCTYVPLDPDYYQDAVAARIRFIGPACVLVDQATLQALPAAETGIPVLAVPPPGEHSARPLPAAVPGLAHGRHPAYILFTSGSTGSPKAVSMGHAALDNLITEISATIDHAAPVVLNYSSIAFDMHFTEVFTALLNGGTVVLADAAMRRNTLALLGLLREEGVTLLNLSYPVLCELAMGADQGGVRLPALRMVLSTAQQLKITPGLRSFFARHPDARLFNHYGPTETHVVTVAALGNEPDSWPDVPDIGKPIRNTACFVVNPSGLPEVPGAIGELYVAGVPLAGGYHANAAMTAQRFVQLDIGGGKVLRAYRTGDFVRMRPDGSLQYYGRKDHEVKIRGLRVDLSDIEASIQRCDGVAQAVVTARQLGAGTQIVAYVQLEGGSGSTAATIEAGLRQALPNYMVPDRLVLVDAFPLNQNAKIDLSRLPLPPDPSGEPGEAAQSVHESAIFAIWSKVLKHDGFGRHTSFFEAGGDSLALMAVKRELDVRYGRDIDLVEIYGSPTIARLAGLVGGTAQAECASSARQRRNLNMARRQRLALAKTEQLDGRGS